MASEASRLYTLQNNLLDGMPMSSKLIAGLSVLFLFLSFLIWLTWDRYTSSSPSRPFMTPP
ncbi:hypothetical protein SPRG_11673 [Saprolegnia parasitica CBS 223.65]|uniref:Uncharacterized protein n=1 Tax=Saprolegnia parasitica (strain CBS 223.65) TaxID=695850 RepID=A0A067C052_SAPPC|nr:hypothetical protein SPRG_11673 [Saprolegnia parasitica CBS 223.65]KDO22490.1 hypothetical protein SPRG_11673 [Saprolegnia parasitica CBS 223.65]|eukprot:XP_012206738.1 hypothetical protein SPRG_11673 [Saprolegnia parasitica CBS 223.65]